MNISYPKSVKVQMDDPSGLYFDIDLVEYSDGMMFEGYLYHPDFSIKSHIISIQTNAVKKDGSIDWFPIICMMNDYIVKSNLITHYWSLIEILEY